MTSQALNDAYVADEAAATNNTINATPTGSTDTAVLRFNTSGTTTGTITEANSTIVGTTVSIGAAGIYHVSFALAFAGAVAVAAGISFGASNAAPITADPVVGVANVIYALDALGVASTNNPISGAVTIRVTQAQITASTNLVRFHATNSAGAAPVGITAAGAQYRITKIADLSV